MQSVAERTDVEFVYVYQREPHARQMAFTAIEQPKDLGERCQLARKTCDELSLPSARVWIDGMDDQSRALFGDLPSPAILIDPQGVIRSKLPWAEPEALQPLVQGMLAAAAKAQASGAAVPAPAVPEVADAPAGDAWPALVACASLAVEHPEDPRWRGWIDRLVACNALPARHWALQRLVERLQAGGDTGELPSAPQQLEQLRVANPWLLGKH